MRKTVVLAIALLFSTAVVFAQPDGTITDGDVLFTYGDLAGDSGAFVDFEVDAGTDHVFAQWWWFRLDGDTSESQLPAPTAESYVGNVATLDFVLPSNLTATEEVTIMDTGMTAGSTHHHLTITNNGLDPVTITVFHYADFDMDATAADDSATLLTPTNIGIMENSVANFRALGADAYQVTSFPDLAGLLSDGGITNLNNTGLDFGPGDFTGAFQWRPIEIPPGASAKYWVVKNVGDPSDPLEVAFAGSCPGPVQLRIAGATPGGTVAIAGGPALGSFVIPGGACAGTELCIDSPRLLATVTADASGRVTRNLNLAGGACGQVVQAVDISSCGTTNTDPIP